MPEGHTIHRLARDHRRLFVGQKVSVESPQGRFAAEAVELNGRQLTGIDAKGKHLFYEFDPSRVVHIHLGLYGKFRLRTVPLPPPQGAVRLRVIGAARGFDLNGPTCCELLDREGRQAILHRLGADPLRRDADIEQAWDKIRRSKMALGSILLNQRVIAGVGNIYRAEVLYQLGIHPKRTGQSLLRSEFDELWRTLCHWLSIGVRYNRIITVDSHGAGKPLSRLLKDERLQIYQKTHCPTCRKRVQVEELAARTIYYCGHCQA